jgi:hypothetical protein
MGSFQIEGGQAFEIPQERKPKRLASAFIAEEYLDF